MRITFKVILFHFACLYVPISYGQLGPYITHQCLHQGVIRPALVHLPAGYQSTDTLPLLFCFHGLNQTPKRIAEVTGFDTIADKENFIVVYPLGKDTVWNTFSNPYFSGTDDVDFISTLIDTLSQIYTIDLNRVYATGMSNGGFMSYKLACHLSHRIAAIAPLAGAFTDSMRHYCSPQRPVPILHIHGTSDFLVGYNNGILNISVPATLQYWTQFNSCNQTPVSVSLPNISTTDNSTVTLMEWKPCDAQTEVIHYKVNGGGHTWPGSAVDFDGLGGNVNRDFSASAVIWQFLSRFSLLTPTSSITHENKSLWHIYPNPVCDYIFIHNLGFINACSIYDVSGNLIYSGNFNQLNSQYVIDFTSQQPGVYILHLYHTDKSPTIVRFINIKM